MIKPLRGVCVGISWLLLGAEGGVLAIPQMEKLVLCGVFLVDFFEGLLCVEEGVVGEEIDGFCVAELQLLLDDHDEFEDCEAFEDEDSRCGAGYLLLSNYFSLLCFTRLSRIGILSGWNFRIISAYFLRSSCMLDIYNSDRGKPPEGRKTN
jgi:hypothetical protein